MPGPGTLDGLFNCLVPAAPPWRPGPEPALALLAWLALLFLWHCYRVGRERAPVGLPRGLVEGKPPAPRLPPGAGRLPRSLRAYAKRYSWAGMRRLHKALREQPGQRPAIQSPRLFQLPELPSVPCFPREAQRHDAELLERAAPALWREYLGVAGAARGWTAGPCLRFYLYRQGVCQPRNCRACPRAYRTLASLRTFMGLNRFGSACFCALPPGTRLPARYGPTNIRLRCHLGLKVPPGCELVVGGEPQCWAEGHCLLLDDSFLHTTSHSGSLADGPCVLFMVDLWHPNVSGAERQALDYLFAPGL
ncbi:aspartate beta-hydroxylase domain-containing protein 1 [Carettochelys insculpta]|uniref:aspartate beta-hydroxylase domain-containing protein 1 n=1 Tax=Carettochelys insculpta TaxID=44489 RepID=UPI003EBF38A0